TSTPSAWTSVQASGTTTSSAEAVEAANRPAGGRLAMTLIPTGILHARWYGARVGGRRARNQRNTARRGDLSMSQPLGALVSEQAGLAQQPGGFAIIPELADADRGRLELIEGLQQRIRRDALGERIFEVDLGAGEHRLRVLADDEGEEFLRLGLVLRRFQDAGAGDVDQP